MILTKKIIIKPNSKTLKFYKDLGYDCHMYSEIEVPIEHLTKGSHQIIDVMCDVCGKEKKLDYNSYWRNTKKLTLQYSCCEKCGIGKRNKTNLNKYGTENVFQNNEIKEKIKDSYIKNLGVDHPSKSQKIQKNTKETCKNKYGDPNYKNTIKTTSTVFKKYGVTNTFLMEKSFLTKKINTIEKYKDIGLIDIKNKKYIIKCDKGHISEVEKHIFFNRLKMNTILCIECNPYASYHSSGMEIQLQNFIKENYKGDVLLNSRISNSEIDIYLPDLKLAFEFNGIYWHSEKRKNKNYHLNKTELAEKRGIKLIHIYEDDWSHDRDMIKSRILNLLSNKNLFELNNNENDDIYHEIVTSNKIYYIVNRSWSNGKELLEKGFKLIKKTTPNYYKIINSKRSKKLNNDCVGIYDSGNLIFEKSFCAHSCPNYIYS